VTKDDLAGLRAFLRAAGALKDTPRTAWTAAGRRESAAEHSWRVALLALALKRDAPGLDLGRALAMAAIHDLGEAVSGDVSAATRPDKALKSARERADLTALLAPAPEGLRTEILGLWEEYEAGESPEARLVRAADKLETVMQHVEGRNPPGFDYGFNLDYGREATDAVAAAAVLRALIDDETSARRDAAPDS
jgi:putative hydrolase of HD superfamily